jgi:hypothetical protein
MNTGAWMGAAWGSTSAWPEALRRAEEAPIEGLQPFQAFTAHAARLTVERLGGVVIASSVGLGKTRTALATAQLLGSGVAVICPASLRSMWRGALRERGLEGEVASFGALASGATPEAETWIIDEAHHLRNDRTQRRAALVRQAEGKRLVLLTATPVQNRLDDLLSLLSLFVSEADCIALTGRSMAMLRRADDGSRRVRALVERAVIRLDRALAQRIDAHAGLAGSGVTRRREREVARWSRPDPYPGLIEAVSSAAAAIADVDAPSWLVEELLLRRWSSSTPALLASLRRAERYLARLEEAESVGATLTRAEFARCFAAEREGGPAQRVLPFWFDREGAAGVGRPARSRREAVAHAVEALEAAPGDMASLTASVLAQCPAMRVTLAFTESVDTAEALWVALRQGGHKAVVMWTGRGARHATAGRMEPDTAIRLLLERAPHTPGPSILISTDVGAEGHNLPFAAKVLHLDLPWNPARREQRVGRLDRLGGPERIVEWRAEPAPAIERRLRLLRRLRAKERLAREAALPVTPDAPASADPWRASWELALLARGAPPLGRIAGVCTTAGVTDGTVLVACLDGGLWERGSSGLWVPLDAAGAWALAGGLPATCEALPATGLLLRRARLWLSLALAERDARSRTSNGRGPGAVRAEWLEAAWTRARALSEAGADDEARSLVTGVVASLRVSLPAPAESAREQWLLSHEPAAELANPDRLLRAAAAWTVAPPPYTPPAVRALWVGDTAAVAPPLYLDRPMR